VPRLSGLATTDRPEADLSKDDTMPSYPAPPHSSEIPTPAVADAIPMMATRKRPVFKEG